MAVFRYMSAIDNFIFTKDFVHIYIFLLITFPPIGEYIKIKKFSRSNYDRIQQISEIKNHPLRSIIGIYLLYDICFIMLSPITITLLIMIISFILFIFLNIIPSIWHFL